MSQVFASDQNDFRCAEAVESKIHLTDVPSSELYKRVPPGQLDEFKEAVEKMPSGVISEPKSPYASPVVLVCTKTVA